MTISTKTHIQFRVARGLAARVMLLGLLAVLASTAHAQPIEIFTADDLDDVRDDLSADYILMADIDLTGFDLAPIGSDADRFTGTFDGNGFTIRNFTYDGFPFESFVGLFGATNGAILTDITLENIDVTGVLRVGGLVGQALYSTISGCKVTNAQIGQGPSSVLGVQNVGGLAGHVQGTLVERCVSYATSHCLDRWSGSLIGHVHLGSTVRDCKAYGKATGARIVGGLSGNVHGSLMERCSSFGDVEAGSVCGGLTGWLQEDLFNDPPLTTIVRDCKASGNVTSTSSGIVFFYDEMGNIIIAAPSNGGLAGWLDEGSVIQRSRASGNITAPDPGDTICGGLVGRAQANCQISGCTAIGDIIFGNTAAGLVGWILDDTLILNCTAFGDVNGEWQSGGLVGASERGIVDSCHAYGNVFARGLDGVGGGHAEPGHTSAAVGGLVGYTFPSGEVGSELASVIRCSSAHGDVSSTAQMTGGLVGLCWGTIITESYSTGNVSSSDRRLGGLIGAMLANPSANSFPDVNERSEIIDCYATGKVTQIAAVPGDAGRVGGLVGYIDAENDILNRIENCYSVGPVSAGGPTVGGLIGEAEPDAVVISSYWDLDTSGQSSSDGGEGKTTIEMMMQATYLGWDFMLVWDIDEGNAYPILRCQPN